MSQFIKEINKSNGRKLQEPVLERLFQNSVDTVLAERLMRDRQYQVSSQAMSRKIRKIEKIKLSRKQWEVVDEAISACNASRSEYGRIAYYQGFEDAVRLLLEITVL